MNDISEKSKLDKEIASRMEAAITGMLTGHQMGQWSERCWFNHKIESYSLTEIRTEDLFNEEYLRYLLVNPPMITTPGWAPQCWGDMIPYIYTLGMEYIRLDGPLSPELFRDFLFRESKWLRPQAVGRGCIELMAEGINPRIAGLYLPGILAGCWIAWPIAFYNAGNCDEAFEEAIKIGRAQNSIDVTTQIGLIASMIAEALKPGAGWQDVRSAILKMAEKRDKHVFSMINEVLVYVKKYPDQDDWIDCMKSKQYRFKTYCKYYDGQIADFYTAVSALEYAYQYSIGWPEMVRMVLKGCDSRFGSMIAMSIRAMLDGSSSIPVIWREKVKGMYSEPLSQWIAGAKDVLKHKLEREINMAVESLIQIKGDEIEKTVLYDKIIAGLLSGAIGNVMGSPVEDRDYTWIVEKYGVVDYLLQPERLETEDDTAMVRLWAETYMRCGGRAYPEDLGESFMRDVKKAFSGIPLYSWYDPFHALARMEQGLPAYACGHWNVETGSAQMGCHPCGMYNAGDPKRAAADATELSYVYQRGFGVHGAAILCAAMAEALRPGATIESVLEAAVESAPVYLQPYFNLVEGRDARKHLRDALAAVEGCPDVLSARKILYDGFLEYNGQDPWEVVTFTLAIFKVARGDVWQCMIGGTNVGRDSDTISNLSAALSACMTGMDGVPGNMLSLFSDSVMDEYKNMARGLTELVKNRCLRWLNTAEQLGEY